MLRALLRDSVIYSLATLLSRGLVILMVPLYTRLLTPADFGALELITILVVLVNLIVPLEVGQGLARFWHDAADDEARARLASTTQLFSLAMYTLFLIAGMTCSGQLSFWLLGSAEYSDALQLGLCLAAANGMFFSLQNQFRWLLQPKAYAMTSVLHGVLLAFCSILLAHYMRSPLLGILAGQLLAACMAGLLAALRLRGWWRLDLHAEDLRRLLAFSWPLALSGVATYASLYAGRLVLNHLASLDEVAIYGLASRVAGIVVFLLVGVQGALTPLIYAHHERPETRNQLAILFSGFAAAALLACLMMALFASDLVTVFGPTSYAEAAPLIGLLAPAALMTQMYVFAPGIALAKKSLWQLSIFLLSAATCIGLSYLLVPGMGVKGAAWATLLSAIVFLTSWLLVSQRFYSIPFRSPQLICALLIYAALLLLDAAMPWKSWEGTMVLACKLVLLLAMAASLFLLGLVRWQDLRRIRMKR